MSIKRVALFALAVAMATGIASSLLMLAKDQEYVSSPPYAPPPELEPGIEVIYYSRSGHSEAVAREIARTLNASISRIDAIYPLSIEGQRTAVADAKNHVLPPIEVDGPGARHSRNIILVSPTWMYTPAMPMWSYIEQANFDGKSVTLVMTGNSRFDAAEVRRFGERISDQGGHMTQHFFIRRGRIWWQMSRQTLTEQSRAIVDELHWSDLAAHRPARPVCEKAE